MKTLRFFCLSSILLSSYSSLQAQALSFALPFEMHFEELTVTLVIGMDPDGSTGFVDGLDALAPPPPPDASAFDARIRVDNVDYFTKFKPNTAGVKEFTFIYAPRQGVSMTWDHESLSDYGTFTVTDLDESFRLNLEDFEGELTPSELGTLVQFTQTFVIRVDPKTATEPMQKSVNLTGREGYRMLSSPVATDYATILGPIWTQGAAGSNNPGGAPNIWSWDFSDGTDAGWTPLADMQEPIVPGSGFLVYVFSDDDPDDPESPSGFPKTITVEGPENEDGVIAVVNPQSEGWSLLGNPFDSPVSFAGLTRQNLTDVIYVWDANDSVNGENGGNNGNTDPGAGSWKTYSLSAGAGDITDGIIAGFQGFFAQNTTDGNGGVTFPASAKTTGGSFYGKQTQADVIRLELNGQDMRSSAWLSFREHGSFDEVSGDAHKLAPLSQHYALLAGLKNGNPYDISILPVPQEDFAFPLTAKATIGGTYTLTVTDWDVSFDQALYLEDRLTQDMVELTAELDYEFSLDAITAKVVAPKSITDPLAWIGDGLVKSLADDEPRFVITASGPVDGEVVPELPAELVLAQNYPNPFNPSTVISYALPEQAHVRVTVYDLTGRRISTLVNEEQSPGSFEVTWDASGLASGMYIYRLEAAGQTLTQRMTLIK